LEAAEQMQRQQDLRKSIELEVEQARYEARLAARRYDAVDPEQRDWLRLSWRLDGMSPCRKSRSLRIGCTSSTARPTDVDQNKREIVLLIHWAGVILNFG
jgi:hypothetical protein